MENPKTFTCFSKFPWPRQNNFFKIYWQFVHVPSKSYATLGLNDYANLKERKINTTGNHTNSPPPRKGPIWCKRNYSIYPFSFIPVYILFSIIYSSFHFNHCNCNDLTFICLINSVALVRERTIPTERPPPVGEVSANFLRVEGCHVVSATGPHGH